MNVKFITKIDRCGNCGGWVAVDVKCVTCEILKARSE